ncbi:MAG: anaerobic ribonucleoside-triphosphate reductase activating protein [Candidatus Woesebacteria bacterium]|nr:anaerobic ribonucleoside-triphosphate reductase activating protein [Candidatus Woesebacteria bacterium]
MIIGGLQKFSLIDYPGKISAVVFLSGCNFRCGFCHNPELVLPELLKIQSQIDEKDFLNFLKDRRGKLDGVCITGGEPTIWQDLPEFIAKIKDLGFLVKLDTNGTSSEMVKKVIDLNLVDHFAIDIKNSPEKYKESVNANVSIAEIEKTLKVIVARGIPLELRTTVVPELINKEDFVKIKEWLEDLEVLEKVSLYAIQQFRPLKTLNKDFEKIKPYSEEELKEMGKVLEGAVKVEIRGI